MKSLVTLLLGSSLILGLNPAQAQPLNVLACEPEWQSLVQALGGEQVKVGSATSAMQNPHHIEARPSLIAKARRAELLVCTGAELEIGWLPLLIRQSGNAHIQSHQPGYFMAAEQVARIDVPQQRDRSMGDIHASGNPHVHLDPQRLLQIAHALSQRLQQIDSPQAEYYRQQFTHFEQRWQQATEQWQQQAAPLQGRKAIVYHSSWNYLLNWLEIESVGNLEPKPGLPPSSSHLVSLLKQINTDKPDFILVAAYQNDRGARWLSEKSGVPIVSLPYTVGGNQQAQDLFSLYDTTLALLLAGLNAE